MCIKSVSILNTDNESGDISAIPVKLDNRLYLSENKDTHQC